MNQVRISLRTTMLIVVAAAVSFAAFTSNLRRRELVVRLSQKRELHAHRLQNLPWSVAEEPDRLQVGPVAISYPFGKTFGTFEFELQSNVQSPEFCIYVPKDKPCQIAVAFIDVGKSSSSGIPKLSQLKSDRALLVPGIHIMRLDCQLDSTGTNIDYGVMIDDEWVIRGRQLIRAPLRQDYRVSYYPVPDDRSGLRQYSFATFVLKAASSTGKLGSMQATELQIFLSETESEAF